MVARGEPVTLECRATGSPAPTITWYRDGTPIDARDSTHRMVLPDGSLFFLSVRHSRRGETDGGVYSCRAENEVGVDDSEEAELTVACELCLRTY